MPRASRVKARVHASAAVLPSKRTFAVPENQVESLIPGTNLIEERVDTIPLREPAESSAAGLRRQRMAAAVVAQPPQSQLIHPYNRSHAKRLRRKRQNITGGDVNPLAAALAESLGQTGEINKKARVRSAAEKEEERKREEEKKREEGKIGEGRGKTLGEKKRREIITNESKRREAILAHSQFKANPWATIRLHAENSLAANVKDKGSDNSQGRRGLGQGKGSGGNKASGAMQVD